MSYRETEHLRVLVANERKGRLALVAPIVAALGHEVIAREIDVKDVGAVTARERPDVAADLEGAFGRRAITERAKGILVERHSLDEADAFTLLREHAREQNRKLVDIATAIVDGHLLFPKTS
jgi:hypothetical protein